MADPWGTLELFEDWVLLPSQFTSDVRFTPLQKLCMAVLADAFHVRRTRFCKSATT